MRKGIASQVFIYNFAVIVMALILYFGFTQIANLKSLQDKSIYVVFKNDFESAVNDVYYKNSGSTLVFSKDSRNKPLELPKEINKICFDLDDDGNNVLLNSKKYDDFKIEHLKNDGCIDTVKGELNFKLINVVDGEETFVEISNVGTQ